MRESVTSNLVSPFILIANHLLQVLLNIGVASMAATLSVSAPGHVRMLSNDRSSDEGLVGLEC